MAGNLSLEGGKRAGVQAWAWSPAELEVKITGAMTRTGFDIHLNKEATTLSSPLYKKHAMTHSVSQVVLLSGKAFFFIPV